MKPLKANTTLGRARLPMLVLLLTVCAVAACSTSRGERDVYDLTPAIGEFPEGDFPFSVAGDRDSVYRFTRSMLRDDGWRTSPERQNGKQYVITVFRDEPAQREEGRVRRTAYLVQITVHSRNENCSDVSLRWIVESRGKNEKTWRRTPEDAQYRPADVPGITRWLEDLGGCP